MFDSIDIVLQLQRDYREHRYQNCQRAASEIVALRDALRDLGDLYATIAGGQWPGDYVYKHRFVIEAMLAAEKTASSKSK